MRRIEKYYDKFEEIFLVICMAVMVILVFVQVVMRYVFNDSLSWSEGLARIIFIWMSWIGISFAEKQGEHVKITMVVDRLHGRAKQIVLIIADILTIAILVIVCYYGVIITSKMMVIGTFNSAVHIPNWVVYASVPLSCFLMGMRVLKKLILTIQGKYDDEKTEVIP